ncbi:MAG: Flp pilus assembly protein CpaB [Acidobacteria bacterium]|nr:Flp pilus assembly protein CpaB [Acidobacteriota bacterium]
MNKRVVVILFSAFIVAAICSLLVSRLVGKRVLASHSNMTRVVVATTDIKLGSVLRDVDVTYSEIASPAPKGAILNLKDAVGRGVVSNLYQNEPVLDSRLAASGSGGGLAANPPGTPNPVDGPKVKTLLQNIQVLSAGTDIQKDQEGKPKPVQVVNLLVTPEQAEDLSLASNQTHIQLVLRNPLDTQIAEPPGTVMANLFADKNSPAPPKPRTVSAPRVVRAAAPQVYLVQVFNGSKRTEEKFVSDEVKK